MKRVVRLFNKETKKLVLEFDQNESICDDQLRRKILFKYGIDPDSVIAKYRKIKNK